ncbi:MAG: hypothetical protein U0168_07780 [Nannocystaceae bacterium]
MTRIQCTIAILPLAGCAPLVDEPIDEEAYGLCEALYDHARSCGDEIDDDAAEHCARNPHWQTDCRPEKKAQFLCYAALSCEDESNHAPAALECGAKANATGDCLKALYR